MRPPPRDDSLVVCHVPLTASTMGFLCVMISHFFLGCLFLSGVMRALGLASGACHGCLSSRSGTPYYCHLLVVMMYFRDHLE